ncbi:MAG: hypothetical protein OXD32_06980 [Endozoicomonadaceae bacterium]|nr:hypothetical protein [Endozoicomonadaceae bacterium]MCY4328931.1 hypothetical protein [Endozoicomonadaceae bacterium]
MSMNYSHQHKKDNIRKKQNLKYALIAGIPVIVLVFLLVAWWVFFI